MNKQDQIFSAGDAEIVGEEFDEARIVFSIIVAARRLEGLEKSGALKRSKPTQKFLRETRFTI